MSRLLKLQVETMHNIQKRWDSHDNHSFHLSVTLRRPTSSASTVRFVFYNTSLWGCSLENPHLFTVLQESFACFSFYFVTNKKKTKPTLHLLPAFVFPSIFFFCELFRSRGCPRGKLKYFTWKAGKKRGREICTSCTDFSIYFLLCRCMSV